MSLPVCARAASKAGTPPKTTAVSTLTPSVNRNTRASTLTFWSFERLSGSNFASASTPHTAPSKPSRPPAPASNRLSTSSCRTMVQRRAPRAMRIAISRRLVVAWANSRFATFAQAISSTKPDSGKQDQDRQTKIADIILVQRINDEGQSFIGFRDIRQTAVPRSIGRRHLPA